MTWFFVDDGLSSHPKVTRFKRGATRERVVGLWTLAGSWSARYLTEGHIPLEQIDELGCTMQSARWLVEARLWHAPGHDCPQCIQPRDPRGFLFHDWQQANQSREQVLTKRLARAEAGAKGGKAAAENRRGRSKPVANAVAVAEASATAFVETPLKHGGTTPGGVPPSSPVPAPPNPNPLTALVCRRLFGDARTSLSDDDRQDLWQLWDETAGQGVDLESELRKWLLHNTATDLRNPGAALLGWLQTAAKRAAIPAAPGCDRCLGGWVSDEFGQPSEHRCTACRPHLRAVETS